MRVLLDTNVVVWLAAEPDTVRAGTLDLLREDAISLVLSAVVPWEVAITWRLGTLVIDEGHPAEWVARVAREFGVQAPAGHLRTRSAGRRPARSPQ